MLGTPHTIALGLHLPMSPTFFQARFHFVHGKQQPPQFILQTLSPQGFLRALPLPGRFSAKTKIVCAHHGTCCYPRAAVCRCWSTQSGPRYRRDSLRKSPPLPLPVLSLALCFPPWNGIKCVGSSKPMLGPLLLLLLLCPSVQAER